MDYKSNKSPMTFGDCEIGDVFRCDHFLYMKINNIILQNDATINAICLENAETVFYPSSTPVEKVYDAVKFFSND